MTGYTANFSFELIDFNLKPWQDKEYGNWTMLDRILSTISPVPQNKGVWRNNTAYAVGDYALDPDTLAFYRCVTAHTTPTTGTFAAYRVTNPTVWTAVAADIGSLRYDITQTLTDTQKTQARTNIGFSYIPVQQGGGANQAASRVVKLGADATGLRADVDGTDLGTVWTDNIAPKTLAGTGYQKLPSGLIVQWGTFVSSTGGFDTITFPVPFPNNCRFATAQVVAGGATTVMYGTNVSSIGAASFTASVRQLSGGTVSSPALTATWFALGN